MIKGMQKGAALALACLMVLGGCAPRQAAKKPSPTHAVKTLQFAVDAELGQELGEQTGRFAANVERLSGGRLHINIVKGEGEAANGAAYDLGCLRNSQLARYVPSLATLSLPFLYNDAEHLSLALNSPEMKKTMTGRLQGQVVPLAALSSGNALLVSTKAPQKKDMTNGNLMPIYFQDTVLAMKNRAEPVMAFEALGARVALMDKASLTDQLGEEASVKPAGEELSQTATVNTVEATMEQVLAMPFDSTIPYVLETRHDLAPFWLTIRESSWKSLSDWEQAVIQEATASFISGYEDNRSKFRSAWEIEAGKRGVQLFLAERQALTATIYDSGNGTAYFLLPDYFDKKLFDLVQSFS